jgi:hypothetical protein
MATSAKTFGASLSALNSLSELTPKDNSAHLLAEREVYGRGSCWIRCEIENLNARPEAHLTGTAKVILHAGR